MGTGFENKTEYFCFIPIDYDKLKVIEMFLYREVGTDKARNFANWLNQSFFPNLEEITTKDLNKLKL